MTSTITNDEIPIGVKRYESPKAYEEIQKDVIKDFSSAIGKSNADIRTIVIVGAYHGYEINYLLESYPNSRVYAFEANPKHYAPLADYFRENPRVEVFNVCIGDQVRPASFYEITLPGSGSIFKYQGDSFGDGKSVDYEFDVVLQPLTAFYHRFQLPIDLLWVDVQGAELQVLQGTDLSLVEAMFLEVKTHEFTQPWDAEPYKGQCFLSDLISYTKKTHQLVAVGLDNEFHTGSGNSLWVKISNP